MGRRSTTGGVKPAGDRIEVRFTYQGAEIRPTLDLRPTAANLAHARRQREQIMQEIKAGTFNLQRHFPNYRFASKHSCPASDADRTLSQWALVWKALMGRELEHSTLANYWRHFLAYWDKPFGHLQPHRLTHEMLLTHLAELAAPSVDTMTGRRRKGLSRKTQNNILTPLRGVFELICKPPSTLANPVAGIKCLKVQTGDPDPFTPDELELILADMRRPRGKMTQDQADALADYYEFAGFAGPRPSEQIALRWTDVDFNQRTVLIRRANVMRQEKDRTKTHKARSVELNARAWAVLTRQRARTQLRGKPDALVFLNPFTGLAWVTGEEQRREWMACLRRVGIRHRPPKELRDTSVSVALMAGADPYWVAAQHGHSVQTMLKDYAKFIPSADRGRNLAAVNFALLGDAEPTDSAVQSQ